MSDDDDDDHVSCILGESCFDVAVIYEKIGDLHCLEGDGTYVDDDLEEDDDDDDDNDDDDD